MKKLLLALFLVFPLVFTACSDDDDDDQGLNGTTWESIRNYEYESNGATVSMKYVYTLVFGKNTCRDIYAQFRNGEPDGDAEEITVRYTYNEPTVTFIYTEDGETETDTATIDGNKLTFEGRTYTKK